MSDPFTTGETVLILTTIGTILTGLVTTWRTGRIERTAKVIHATVNIVHEATNSRLSRIEGELTVARNDLAVALAALHATEDPP